jgi:signal transduction histidine kinase
MSILQDIELRAGLHAAEERWPALQDGSDLSVILDSIPANIAILDCKGLILRVNEAWNCFARENGAFPDTVGVGANYLSLCDLAAGADAEIARRFACGIRAVISGITDHFAIEYPCHSPMRRRWFMGHVTAIPNMAPAALVVAHVEITLQKVGEEKIRILNEELEFRVIERTSELCAAINALEKQVNQRRELEQEILNIAERETLRVGQDLHDGLCQTLSGIAFMTRALQHKLQQGTLNPETASNETGKIAHLLIEAIKEAHGLASGMFPANIEEFGLEQVLKQFAAHTSDRFHIGCKFISNGPVVMPDSHAAIHLYRIAQEAVSNAINHGNAKLVLVNLSTAEELTTLKVVDNGSGRLDATRKFGMGLKPMEYRARVIGGGLEIRQRRQHGLMVICSFPNQQRPE